MRFRVNAVFMLFACAASGLALGQQTRSETDVSGNWMMSADLFGSTTYLRMELKQAGFDRGVLLGDFSWLCHSLAQLHQPQRTAWLVAVGQPAWPTEGDDETAIGSQS
jgi:hypothetical protein